MARLNPISRFRQRFILNCREVNRFLVAYLDRDMPEETLRSFDRHLSLCAHCRAYLDQYRATLDLTGEAGTLPEELPEELVETTLAFLKKHGRPGE
jgi:predicted anti-sigma-YlaC factor YlaD